MAKTVTLTPGERVKAVELLNTGTFSNIGLAVVLDDIKKLVVTPEDWIEADLKKTPTDEEIAALPAEKREGHRQVWTWDEKAIKEVELDSGTVEALLGFIKKKSDDKELTMADGAILSLEAKLKA